MNVRPLRSHRETTVWLGLVFDVAFLDFVTKVFCSLTILFGMAGLALGLVLSFVLL